MTHCEIVMDFRVGGGFTQRMSMAHGGDFSFTGKHEGIVEQGNQTRMVLTQEGFPNEFFCKTVSQGTMEGLEKLDQLLVAQAV